MRRVATAGFIALNIDLAARDGGAGRLTDTGAYNAALGSRSIAQKNAVGGLDVKAAVPYYGPQPSNYADLNKTRAAVFAVYAQQDTRITDTAPQMEEQLKKAGVDYKVTVYPNVNHAFHNDTGNRYDPAQARAACVATMA